MPHNSGYGMPAIPGGPGGMAFKALELWKKMMKKRRGEGVRIPTPGGGILDPNRIPNPTFRDAEQFKYDTDSTYKNKL